jgi:hypothetical protein
MRCINFISSRVAFHCGRHHPQGGGRARRSARAAINQLPNQRARSDHASYRGSWKPCPKIFPSYPEAALVSQRLRRTKMQDGGARRAALNHLPNRRARSDVRYLSSRQNGEWKSAQKIPCALVRDGIELWEKGMTAIQRFFMALLPQRWAEDMRVQSQSWQLRCCTCGATRSVWDAGLIRWKAASVGKRITVNCSQCGRFRMAAVERTAPPL